MNLRNDDGTRISIAPVTGVEQVWWPEAGRYTDYSLVPHAGESYRASVPQNIADLNPSIPPSIAGELERATLELRAFDDEFGGELSAFATLLVRSEALSSSQIERVDAKARQVVAAEIGESDRSGARLIAAAGSSLRSALTEASDVGADLARGIHASLLADQPRLAPGEWRSDPIWVGTSSTSPHGADFVAPPAELVPELMADWSAFAARDDVPAFAQALIAHAQFETIHPFRDGNGRTGRALLQAQLRRRGITRRALVPVSAGLLTDTDGYFNALASYQAGDAAPILRAGREAVTRSVANATQLVEEVRSIRTRFRETLSIRAHSRAWDVLDYAIDQPVFTARLAAERLGIAPSNVQRHLDRLVDDRVLQASTSAHRRRGRVYRAQDILDALDRFAERSARRPAA
ncbi:MAG: Fic family protein [Pseudoclavibacter sp.]